MQNCSICKKNFEFSGEEKALFTKFKQPIPDMCFLCQHKHRLSFRNDRTLYKRKCNATGQDIISIYSPDKPFPVYKPDYWHSDKWDPLQYGRDFDFSRPFFEQFAEIQLQVPRTGILNVNSENSDYCNTCFGNKNSYLVFGGDLNQDVLYGTLCMRNRNSLDIDYTNDSELTYETCDLLNSYNCQYAFNSKNCSDCFYIEECIGCKDCILCINLRNKQYCIENKEYSREDYFNIKKSLITGSSKKRNELFEKFKAMRQCRVTRATHTVNCENCTGDYLKNSKNCQNCYDTADSEDCYEIIFGSIIKDCFNADLLGDNSELVTNCTSTAHIHNVKNSYFIIDSSDIEYSEICFNSSNLFGCIGLKHQQYCILNKKYLREEYEKLKEKIIEYMHRTGEYGQFFPKKLSHVCYNESTAYEYFPMIQEEALSLGFKWHDEPERQVLPQAVIIPDNILDVSDCLCDEALVCENCGKNFRILQQELEFYRKNLLPIPRKCERCRHYVRMSLRNPRKLWNRNCMKCGNPIQTTYSPNSSEIVYCESCFLKDIY